MKHIYIYISAAVFIVLMSGCSMTKASFDQSNHVFFERAVDNMQVGKAINNSIPKGSKVAIRSLELESTVDRPVISILEDQMIQALLNAGYAVVERDDNALNHLFKESNSNKFNIPKNKYAWLSGKNLQIETQSFPEGSELDFIQTNLAAADYLLCYRIQECGIRYETMQDSNESVMRNGLVRLHVRVYDAKTGEVKFVSNITGTNSDEIERDLMDQLSNFHYTNFFPYDYPLQYGKVSSNIEISSPIVKKRFYFRPMLASISSEKASGAGFDFGLGYYAGDRNRYFLNMDQVYEDENEYGFVGLCYARKYKAAQFNIAPVLGLGLAHGSWQIRYYVDTYYGGYWDEDYRDDSGLGIKLGCTVEYPFYNKNTISAGVSFIQTPDHDALNGTVLTIGFNF